MPNHLIALYHQEGQSPWLDNLKRSYITSGALDALRERGVRGLTSNPTIFQNAIQGSNDYDAQLRKLVARPRPTIELYWELVITDIHGACNAFATVHELSNGADGYVSVEVDPRLAHDQEGTEAAARSLQQRIDRPNLMVKVPGTKAGVSATQTLIGEGRSINITLIFSIDRYADVMEAYISGLESLAEDPTAELAQVASVASFFISRVDVAVDEQLNADGSPIALALRGKTAIAQAKLAYRLFTETYSGPRWEALAARGARIQRPLWASTATKNPAYSDTLYVDELIGPDSVNTMPDGTLEAFADHGTTDRRIDHDLEAAEGVWEALAELGIDMDAIAKRLEEQGLIGFETSFDELISAIEQKAAAIRKWQSSTRRPSSTACADP